MPQVSFARVNEGFFTAILFFFVKSRSFLMSQAIEPRRRDKLFPRRALIRGVYETNDADWLGARVTWCIFPFEALYLRHEVFRHIALFNLSILYRTSSLWSLNLKYLVKTDKSWTTDFLSRIYSREVDSCHILFYSVLGYLISYGGKSNDCDKRLGSDQI